MVAVSNLGYRSKISLPEPANVTFVTPGMGGGFYFCNMQVGVQFLSFFMALLLWGSTLRTPLIYAYYMLDQEGFIEQLCENKDKPELKCDGKCYLSQMLKASSEAEEEKSIPVVEWKELQLFHDSQQPSRTTLDIETGAPITTPVHRYAYTPVHRIFHPPPVASISF